MTTPFLFTTLYSPFVLNISDGLQCLAPCGRRRRDCHLIFHRNECMQTDQQFVEDMVRAIVNNPNDVKTERTVDERGVLITLHINQQDMGYVIGRQGQTARALRTLLRIVGAKNNARVNLKIHEPEGSTRYARPAADDNVDVSAVGDLNI